MYNISRPWSKVAAEEAASGAWRPDVRNDKLPAVVPPNSGDAARRATVRRLRAQRAAQEGAFYAERQKPDPRVGAGRNLPAVRENNLPAVRENNLPAVRETGSVPRPGGGAPRAAPTAAPHGGRSALPYLPAVRETGSVPRPGGGAPRAAPTAAPHGGRSALPYLAAGLGLAGAGYLAKKHYEKKSSDTQFDEDVAYATDYYAGCAERGEDLVVDDDTAYNAAVTQAAFDNLRQDGWLID